MIVTASAPTRISLFGGGTDLPAYATKYGGLVTSFAINLRQHITLYTEKDIFAFNNGEAGPNQFPTNANPDFLYSILEDYGLNGMHKIKIKSTCDIPLESGLGSSSAVAVALISALNKVKNIHMTANEVAEKAFGYEEKMGWVTGKQDFYASAFGGCNVMQFTDKVVVTPLGRAFIEPLQQSFVLMYIGPRDKKKPQDSMVEISSSQLKALQDIKDFAYESLDAIGKANYIYLGKLLGVYWKKKKQSNLNVTNKKIDDIYEKAISARALGGKLLGAGSGGYMLFIVGPNDRDYFLREMAKEGLTETDFSFDFQGADARIVKE